MGAAQSTRKITLVEDDKAGVIKLSESLAQRLRGQIEGQQAAAAAAAVAAAAAAQKANHEAAQEPLHVSPSLPPQAPVLPPPPPSFIEKPLPIPVSPEPPKIPEVVSVPEPPKIPEVSTPEPPKVSVVPEPVIQEPPEPVSGGSPNAEAPSEPLVPEPPSFLGEFLPPDNVDVDPSLPLSSDNIISDETSLSTSVKLPPFESAQIEAIDDVHSQISEPKESSETEVSELGSPASVEESVAFSADDSASSLATPVVEELVTVAEADAVVTDSFIEAVLPSAETLLSAAFASNPIDTSAKTEVTELASPTSVEETVASGEENVAFSAESAAPPASEVVEELVTVAAPEPAAAVITGKVEVVLPPPETLLSAAFASDPTDTTQSAPIESVVEVPVLPSAPVSEEPSAPIQTLPEAPSTPNVNVAVKAGPSPTLTQPAGSIPPWSIYAEEAHLMVMRLREEKEQEIKKLNNDWREKLDAREKEFIKMARLSEEQVASTLKEVEGLFMKASCSPVCQNNQEAVMHCYQDHPRQSLRCAREVEQFAQCVDLSRLQSVMKQEAH